MSRAQDYIGQKFNRLTVVADAGRNKFNQHLWRCACECGRELTTVGYRVRTGAAKSCGCWNKQVAAARAVTRSTTHGGSSRTLLSPEYKTWQGMRGRCLYPTTNSYELYGGRGIHVCERWNDFAQFLADMGPKPTPDHSIDRIDGDGNYEPDNCRWATPLEQRHNRRTT